MVWKIFFILFALLFAFLQINGITGTLQVTEVNLALGYILSVVYVFIGGYFFALGWRKKLFSLKANNIIFSGILLFILLTVFLAVYSAMPQLFIQSAGQEGHSRFIGGIVTVSLFSLLLYSIIYSPVITAFFKYKKYFSEMAEVKRPYWKLFLTYSSVVLIINTVYLLFALPLNKINLWDWIVMVSVVVDVLFMVGYAYNVKFGKQIFWKIISIPYSLLMTACVFLCSEDFMSISQGYLIKESYVVMAGTIIMSVAYFYALYRYAFSKDVYSDTPAEINENNN